MLTEERDEEKKSKNIKRVLSVDVSSLQKENRNERRVGRVLAVQALYAFEIHRLIGEIKIAEELCLFDWEKKFKSASFDFAKSLVKGTLLYFKEIDEMIKLKLVGWEYDRISPINKSIFRLSIYQLLYEKDIPDVVVINEAVDLSKIFSEDQDYKFVNALLDKVKMELIVKK